MKRKREAGAADSAHTTVPAAGASAFRPALTTATPTPGALHIPPSAPSAQHPPGTVFLLAAMWASSSTRSTREPSTPCSGGGQGGGVAGEAGSVGGGERSTGGGQAVRASAVTKRHPLPLCPHLTVHYTLSPHPIQPPPPAHPQAHQPPTPRTGAPTFGRRSVNTMWLSVPPLTRE